MPFNARTLALPATIPFVGPEALERRFGRPFLARLGANESVFGPSPLAVEAMSRAARDSWAYGDPEHHALREAIAARLGIRFEEVVVGEGIDGLFGLLAQVALEPGDRALTSLGAYPTFNYHVTGHGGTLDFVPYREDREDVDALIERMRATRPKLVYFANPDNPTGSWHEAEAVRRLMDAVPEGTLLVLDEAYSDLAPATALPSASEIRPNVLRFRTFSKAYGMAGVRVAFVFGAADAVAQFHKVRNHFGVSRMAQAGALAALGDETHLRDTVQRIARARGRLADIAAAAGLRSLPSATNFVAIDCGRDGAYACRVLEGVLGRQVFIRMPGVAPLDRMIRVTVGRDDELDRFAAALRASLAQADA
ncbi:pyridoxal phosphate-dependent aminotransferase [Aureimonas flava]|uniref:histidinol-phosphate transaminase n=1 Tax=Aureimonas flava TaxID=2320271 RepID=A0A3A1WTS6_9HYPH|nr:pyridoxal phosphate-dependent aminotransferase [Aureimonas flava]RIY01321.1 pyridoxal phosphate-dependent aminotransferase [Aureimonas flava]